MKPMLACSTIPKLDAVNYPVIASPKLDGFRCLIIDGKARSRSLKLIPNKYIQTELAKLHALHNLNGLDGELMLKNGACFNDLQSEFMRVDGAPDFEYMVFDSFTHSKLRYTEREYSAFERVLNMRSSFVKTVPAISIANENELTTLWEKAISDGYEGLIVRDPKGPYKFGRSTLNQGWMLKLKKFYDDEAIIIGFEELMRNENPSELDELGHNTRSHSKENMIPAGTLGSFVVKWHGIEFKIGTGLTAEQRQSMWDSRVELKYKLIKFKYQELSKYGTPRFPVVLGLRNEDDL